MLSRNSGTIISPKYPERLYKPADDESSIACRWTIKVSPGSKLAIHIVDFNILDNFLTTPDLPVDCNYVRLTISNVFGAENGFTESKNQIARVCLGEDFDGEEVTYSGFENVGKPWICSRMS